MNLKKDSKLSTNYIYSYLKQLDFNNLGNTSSIATAINSTIIKELKIPIPGKIELEIFENKTKEIFNKIHNNTFKIDSLIQLREILLPKFMTGKIRVPMEETQ